MGQKWLRTTARHQMICIRNVSCVSIEYAISFFALLLAMILYEVQIGLVLQLEPVLY